MIINVYHPMDLTPVYNIIPFQASGRDVVLLYRPECLHAVDRTHIVASDYLEEHRTATSFCLDTKDVEEWLALESPGVLYRVHPQCQFERQMQLECVQAQGDMPSHYSVPFEGGHFEATSPEVDIYVSTATKGPSPSGI